MRIAVDVGFGYTKAVNEAGKKVSFPSVVAPRAGGGIEIVGGNQDDYIVTLYSQGQRFAEYLVGDAALVSNGTRAWDDKFAENRNLKTLIAVALALLGDGSPVSLSIGLPMVFYRHQKDEVKNELAELDMDVKIEGHQVRPMVAVKDVIIYPQGAGVYYATVLTPNGGINDLDLINQSVGVIDIGHRTTDVMAMARGKKGLAPREEMIGGFDYGMNMAVKQIKAMADTVTSANIPVHWVEQALNWNNGVLEYKGKAYNLKTYESQVYSQLAEQIAAGVKQKWGQETDRLSVILIAGGGGKALYPYLKAMLLTAELVKEPSYANAQGFLAAQSLSMRKTAQRS
ncbi:MAG: ParM/StbA family protein [Firmicutes bacterium]|nr:ParM/StbA family protein [Bacillota bacterium]